MDLVYDDNIYPYEHSRKEETSESDMIFRFTKKPVFRHVSSLQPRLLSDPPKKESVIKTKPNHQNREANHKTILLVIFSIVMLFFILCLLLP